MFSDEQQSARLRAGIADIEARLSQLRAQPMTEDSFEVLNLLSTSWAVLVASMDLPVPAERRACPFCKYMIVRAATRCVHCWRKSAPDVP